MTFREVRLVAGKELRETLRDRRTLAVMVLFPLVVYPLVSLVDHPGAWRRVSRASRPGRPGWRSPARPRWPNRSAPGSPRHRAGRTSRFDAAGHARTTSPPTASTRWSRWPRRRRRRDRPPSASSSTRRAKHSRTAQERIARGAVRRSRPELPARLHDRQRRHRAAHQRQRLPAVEDPAAGHGRDGDAGGVPPGHRHHGRRTRAQHPRNDAVGAHQPRRR